MSLSLPAVSTAFRTGASTFKNQTWRISLRLCVVVVVQLLSLMIGYGIELEPQIIFQKLNPANSNKIEVSKQWNWLPKFLTFVNKWIFVSQSSSF